ncbi:hypothetical protein BASA84_001342 [Batrachochytrium salamandrivorans]|nr:hypothetical protein BASA84_001342 [Batrachochytrium salamandrivorans]
MWIDTAGTLPVKKSANRAAQHPITMPRPHRFMLHSPVQPTLVQICFAVYDFIAEILYETRNPQTRQLATQIPASSKIFFAASLKNCKNCISFSRASTAEPKGSQIISG